MRWNFTWYKNKQASQAALKVLITKHTVNTDTEGLDQELQPCGHSMDPCTITDSPTYKVYIRLNKHVKAHTHTNTSTHNAPAAPG